MKTEAYLRDLAKRRKLSRRDIYRLQEIATNIAKFRASLEDIWPRFEVNDSLD